MIASYASGVRHTFYLIAGTIAASLVMGLVPPTALGEWYVGGYGGYSVPNKLTDVKMNQLGERLDTQYFQPGGTQIPPTGTYSQTLSASDVDLKQSAMFGGRAGYFFNDQGFSWLGVEIEAFTTKPTIKNQTVSTVHDIAFVPFEPDAPSTCILGVNCQIQQSVAGKVNVPESSMRLYTVAFNVVARYPGKVFQPYVGVGAGAFYFTSTGGISGRQVVPGFNSLAGLKILATEEWGLFIEGKYNRATITNLDPNFGLSGEYSAFNLVAGIAYHF